MEIVEQIKEHNVTDYEFVFQSGNKLSVTVDHDAGDAVNELGDHYNINIVARPSPLNSEDVFDAESIQVYKSNLAFISKRDRKQRMATEEEKLDISKFIHKISDKIQ